MMTLKFAKSGFVNCWRGPGAANCVNEHMTIVDNHGAFVDADMTLCFEKQRVMLRWTLRHQQPPSPPVRRNPRGAIWNFEHVEMSWRWNDIRGIRYSIVVDRDLWAGCAMRPKLHIRCQKWFATVVMLWRPRVARCKFFFDSLM